MVTGNAWGPKCRSGWLLISFWLAVGGNSWFTSSGFLTLGGDNCEACILQQLGLPWLIKLVVQFSSVHFSLSVLSNSLQPHGLQDSRLPCPSPTPGVYPNSCPLSRWCHPTISSSLIPFFSCPQSFPASGSFQMSQVFVSDGQNIRLTALASVLSMNIEDWFPLGWTGWISLQPKRLWRVFSNTTVQKHQFFGAHLSL